MLAYLLAAILVLSALARWWAKLHGVDADTSYYMTWSRLDGLSFGALVALYCKAVFFTFRNAKWVGASALAAGAPASLWLLAGHSRVLWSLLYSMFALVSAGLVMFAIWCCHANSTFGRPFRANWLRYMGQVSYCLYLVHQPVYYVLNGRAARNHFGTGSGAAVLVMILGFVVSISIAGLSWYLFESQILKLKIKLEYHQQAESIPAT